MTDEFIPGTPSPSSEGAKRPIFLFISSAFRPSNLIQVLGFDDDYVFGVLQSHAHWLWFATKCGKIRSDYRYSAESVYDTFPWPQEPTKKAMLAVAEAGREVRRIRTEALPNIKDGLRELYRTLELPSANPLEAAQAALDTAVLAAKDLLAQLLSLNQSVAANIESGQSVTAPSRHADAKTRADYITTDCIRQT